MDSANLDQAMLRVALTTDDRPGTANQEKLWENEPVRPKTVPEAG